MSTRRLGSRRRPRSRGHLGLVLIALSVALAQIPPAASGVIRGARVGDRPDRVAAWREFQFDGAHSGWNRLETTIGPSNVAQLTELWSTDVGGFVGGLDSLSTDGWALYASLFTQAPVALDPDTGGVLWTATAAEGTTTPAVADGMVVVGSGIDNDYYGIEAGTGETRWTFSTSYGAFSPPTVFGHDVLVGSIEGTLRSLDVKTGAVVWSRSIGDPIAGSPAVWQGRAYVATHLRRWVAAVDAKTGAVLWKVKLTGGGTSSSPVLSGGTLYVLAYGSLIALDASTGRIRWHTDGLGGQYVGTPAVAAGAVYVASRIPSQMAAVDAKTGAVLWTTPVDQDLPRRCRWPTAWCTRAAPTGSCTPSTPPRARCCGPPRWWSRDRADRGRRATVLLLVRQPRLRVRAAVGSRVTHRRDVRTSREELGGGATGRRSAGPWP